MRQAWLERLLSEGRGLLPRLRTQFHPWTNAWKELTSYKENTEKKLNFFLKNQDKIA